MTNPLNLGDVVGPIFQTNATLTGYGIVGDTDTPDQTYFTIEGKGSNAILTSTVLKGDKGDPGDNAPLGIREFPIFDDVDDLPTNLTDDDVDIGKYWIVRQWDDSDPPNQIGSWWYMWNGAEFEQFKMGEPGQAGPVPKVTPVFTLVTDDDTDTWSSGDRSNGYRITKTGDDYNPTWTIEVNRELLRGPAGTGTAWTLYTTGSETVGDIPVWDGSHYVATSPEVVGTKFWTYPEGHFTSVSLAIGTRVAIGTALIPPVGHDVVVDVAGHFRLTGVELDTTPFIIGVEVRLGNATSGQVVARGYGNITGYVNLTAHASTSATPNDAITPDNGRGVIPANSTGASATLYVNAFNDGAAGLYNFDADGAQLSVRAYPV